MSNFKILLSSDNSYENLIAEIYFKEKYIGLIHQDNPENLIFEMPAEYDKSVIVSEFPLIEFLRTLKKATESLGHCFPTYADE